ncbi:MAG: hypothetical protein NWE89_05695 [Candidatus Bathyarchaeota archaeon]|nr:hypothetical protein [Candidatus Bathyarchaeota archaeon]
MGTLQEKIIQYMAELDRPISPSNIAQILKENPNSVRSRLTRMVSAGLITRVYHGHYRVIPVTGVGSPPKVQNLQVIALRSQNPELFKRVKSHTEVRTFPSPPGEEFSVRVQFGEKRHQINYTVKAPTGLDYYGLLAVRAYAEEVVHRRTGLIDLNWDVIKFDWLRDTFRIQMEGVKVVSIDDLSGLMLKFYNKLYGLRQEIAVSPKASNLQELIGVMSGGIPQYQMTNQLAILVAQFDKFQAGFGLIFQGLEKQGRLMNALTKAILRDRDEKPK